MDGAAIISKTEPKKDTSIPNYTDDNRLYIG